MEGFNEIEKSGVEGAEERVAQMFEGVGEEAVGRIEKNPYIRNFSERGF